MSRITLDLDALQSSSASMASYIAELNSLCLRLNTQAANMTASWQGESSKAFLAMMTDYASRAQKTTQVLDAYKRYVDMAVQRFSDIDSMGAARIRGSF